MSPIKLKYHKIAHTWPRSWAGAIFQPEHGLCRIPATAFDKLDLGLLCYLLVGESEMAIPSTFRLPERQGQKPHPLQSPSVARLAQGRLGLGQKFQRWMVPRDAPVLGVDPAHAAVLSQDSGIH